MDENDIRKKAAGEPAGADSVDDILRDIMKPDGTFNEDFSELFSRYLGGSVEDLRLTDLSDRRGEPAAGTRVEYASDRREIGSEAPVVRDTAERISQKLPPEARASYERETRSAVRPEFTNEGTVRYPSMGIGASEERVVYDADWEERAKQEALRREKIRRENMLKGDSPYVRDFRFSSADERYNRPNVNAAFIDPLDDSKDVPLFSSQTSASRQTRQENGQEDGPFFRKGSPKSKR